MKKLKKAKKGFTLIELIVVIAILGILAAVLLPKFAGFTDDARKKSAMSEAKTCYTAIAGYYSERGKYPTTGSDAALHLEGDLGKGVSGLAADGKEPTATAGATSPKLFTYTSKDLWQVEVQVDGQCVKATADDPKGQYKKDDIVIKKVDARP